MRKYVMMLAAVAIIILILNFLINVRRRDKVKPTRTERPSTTPAVGQAVLPEYVHLSFGSNPSEMVVTWMTKLRTSASIVEYGVTELDQRATGNMTLFIDGGSEKREMYIHRVVIRRLVGNKQLYKYHCGSSAGWSENFSFWKMRQGSDWAPRLALFGDLGADNPVSLPYLQKEVKQIKYDAIIHLGDIAYQMHRNNGYIGDQFMQEIEPIAAHVPYMVTPGNHDHKYNFSHYENRFSMMGLEGEFNNYFYSWNIGPVHVISFTTEFYYDSNFGMEWIKEQYQWLEEDLYEANKPENRNLRPWIITTSHRPLYCSNTLGECSAEKNKLRNGFGKANRFGLEDLLHRYKVDIQFAAHKHVYERWWPLYNEKIYKGSPDKPYTNPGAPVHIISGVPGSIFLQDFGIEEHPFTAFRSTEFGYTRLHILNKTHLHLEQIAAEKDGAIVDDMMLVKTNSK